MRVSHLAEKNRVPAEMQQESVARAECILFAWILRNFEQVRDVLGSGARGAGCCESRVVQTDPRMNQAERWFQLSSFAMSTFEQEVLLGSLQEHLKPTLLPKAETSVNLARGAQPGRYAGEEESWASFFQLGVVALPWACHSSNASRH